MTTEYQGSTEKATLDIAGKEKFVINLPDAGFFASGPSDGDTALASWDTADMHVLSVADTSEEVSVYGDEST